MKLCQYMKLLLFLILTSLLVSCGLIDTSNLNLDSLIETPNTVVEPVETPEEPEITVQVQYEETTVVLYVVQEDNTLWGIAELIYGKPDQWEELYEANKDRIENPALIFAGQTLIIPDFDCEEVEIEC